MAKIGSYIHYNYINYVKNGGGDINSILATQRALIKQRAMALSASRNKSAVTAELENTLNFFRGKDSSPKLNWSDSDVNEIENAIEQLVLSKLNIDGDISIDFDTLDVYDSSSMHVDKQGKKSLSEKGTFNSIDSINARLKILEATINSASSSISSGNLANITNIVHNLQNNWQILMKSFTASAEAGGMVVNDIQAISAFGKNNGYIKGADDFIANLNKAWNMFSKEVKSYLKGEVAEYYAGIVAKVVKAGGAKAAKELLNEFTKNLDSLDKSIGKIGGDRSAVALWMDKFAVTGMGKNYGNINHGITASTGQNLFTDFSGGKIRLNSTQDKVDLVIDLKDGGTINASLKNYNTASGRNITVHSGVSVLSLMQEDGDFLNHYLNITASVTGDGPPSHRVSDWARVALANRVLKESMVLKAISGGILKFNTNTGTFGANAQAEVLILNGSDGQFKVYFVDDLIDKIMSDVQTYVKVDGIEDNTTWPMSWVGDIQNWNYPDAYSRINALLSSLHSFKLHISLNPILFS